MKKAPFRARSVRETCTERVEVSVYKKDGNIALRNILYRVLIHSQFRK